MSSSNVGQLGDTMGCPQLLYNSVQYILAKPPRQYEHNTVRMYVLDEVISRLLWTVLCDAHNKVILIFSMHVCL